MTAYVKASGTWREVKKVYTKVNGTWREVKQVWTYAAGGWKAVFKNEIRYINTVNRTQATIHEIMGSPTSPAIYIFENHATITAATRSGWALQTGAFPAGSVLKIINKGHIRGGGGRGGAYRAGGDGVGAAGGSALVLNFPASIDNTSGTIWGGGGGGGGADAGDDDLTLGGGGGAGIPAGSPGGGTIAGAWGSETGGGRGGYSTPRLAGGDGGGPGAAGAAGVGGVGGVGAAGGRGGYSVQTNGTAVTWIATGDLRGAVV